MANFIAGIVFIVLSDLGSPVLIVGGITPLARGSWTVNGQRADQHMVTLLCFLIVCSAALRF